MTVLVLGDQLCREVGPVARRPDERVVMIEATEFGRRLPYHPHKLTLVFSAMRHFRDALRADGRPVEYRQVERFADGFDEHFDAHPGDDLVAMRPVGDGAARRLRNLVGERGGTLEFVRDERFLSDPATFDEIAGEPPFRHEGFYRAMRRRTGYLMTDGEPLGGEWNYDDENRDTPPADYDPPDPPRFEPDGITQNVQEWVDDEFLASEEVGWPQTGAWADPEPFAWPVTREEALTALADFVTHRLPDFGPYQDAMVADEPTMNHALLSPALNLGLLRPSEVIERAIAAGGNDAVPINSLEGFVRQVLGWREFVRHVYRRTMPDLASANQLGADRDLPDAYWTGDTGMRCLHDAVEGVRRRGYAHHIERLMVLSNFALLYGVDPAQLNEWFHAGFVDAFHWVTTPNVIEMGSFGAGVFASKPYAASANYVDRMSDFCGDCRYDHRETTGDDACPFNALYWDFLDRNEDRLRPNGRMALVYSHLDDKDEDELAAIRERAREVRRRGREGEL
ncbi:MAG: deoxyribodipyrimidine photolyase-related protein [Halobacteriales archaeon]|jgi:deoxyribodipyrimidine photolyase-related protein